MKYSVDILIRAEVRELAAQILDLEGRKATPYAIRKLLQRYTQMALTPLLRERRNALSSAKKTTLKGAII